MAVNYDRQNDKLKGIQYQRANIEKIVAGLDFNDNCIVTGGMDVTFTNGAKVANRKLILENVLKRLINECKKPVVVFYKSPYLINQIIAWYRNRNIQRECNVVSGPLMSYKSVKDNRCLAPFLDMTTEEIIYTVRSMSEVMHITFDQYSEKINYLVYEVEEQKIAINFNSQIYKYILLKNSLNFIRILLCCMVCARRY